MDHQIIHEIAEKVIAKIQPTIDTLKPKPSYFPEIKPEPNIGEKFLTAKEVAQKLTLSRTSMWRPQQQGAFPSPKKISANRVGWLESEIVWMKSRS